LTPLSNINRTSQFYKLDIIIYRIIPFMQ
jgi:hypothetical protein